MHSTQTNVALGSRPTADHWWRQEGFLATIVVSYLLNSSLSDGISYYTFFVSLFQ